MLGVHSLGKANRSLEHSYQVINLLVSAEAAMHEAEAKARGFRTTGRDDFRPQFDDAVERAAAQGRQLVALTADNPAQQRRARVFETAVRDHLRTMEILFDPAALASLDNDALQHRIDANLARVDNLGTLRREMMDEESRLLAERRDHSRMRAAFLVAFIVAAFVIALGVLGVLLSSLVRENRRSRALEREARTAVRDLRQALALRDTLSEQRRAQSVYAGMLQSCQSRDEIVALTTQTIAELVPGAGGRCYLAKPSQNFLESVGDFGEPVIASADVLTPDQCWALRRGQPHHLHGRAGGLRCAHLDPDAPFDGISTLCVPLVANGQSLGLLHVSAGSNAGGRDGDNDAPVLCALAEQMSMAIANLQLRETLRLQSIRDPLTGLFNRRYLEESLARELQRCERRGLPLSVLMLDIDHFKRFNDTYGHAAGDALLGHIGHLIQSRVRAEDIACRYGGEEFTVVMPELDAANTCARAEEVRKAIEDATVQHLGQTLGPVTISIGIATSPGDGTEPGQLLQTADAALYRAKAAGRNRVLHAGTAN
ncbi:diguanylate cyclase [Luteimonas sp. BDR2-5]|nr:diguanylate cyclase [Luteimonas sp. BDR2-5]